MVLLKTCWSPCIWNTNVKSGTYSVAYYTAMMSVVLITYIAYVMSGGESSYYYLPLFETDIKSSTQVIGTLLILYFLLFIAFSVLLCIGVHKELRGLFFPWFIWMSLAVLFQVVFGLWLLFGYYIYLRSVFVTLCCWLWAALNTYCICCVIAMYQLLVYYQSRNLEILYF